MDRNIEAVAGRRESQQFVELLAVRDFGRLAETLAQNARARLLLPHGLEEHAGRDAIVGRIESWFGSASEFELLSSSAETVGARQRLSWRFSVVRGGGQREAIEQLVFLDHGPDGIGQMDLLCSGFQLDPDVAESTPH